MAVYIRGNNVENAKKYVLLCKTSNGEYEIVQHDKILNPSENINFEISNLSEKTENGFSFAPGLYFFAVEAWAEEYEKSNISNLIEYEFIDNTIYYFVNFEYKDELGNDLNNGILLTEKFAENTEFFFESKKINFENYILETIKINSEEVSKENNSIIINNNTIITYVYKKIETEIPSPPEDEIIIKEPNSYELIKIYNADQTWIAPETGYFQIELFGASGNGGNAINASDGGTRGGGGGGGGGYACSRIKMNKGDTIVLTVGAVGATTIADINSSLESYSSPQVTSGGNGGDGKDSGGGVGGARGVASDGNYSNTHGGKGKDGANSNLFQGATGGTGGPGTNGAPNGGNGGSIKGLIGGSTIIPQSGSAGFIKISRGNTNIVTPEGIEEPTSFEIVGTYYSSSEFMAPESGYFLVELQGASGSGGALSGKYNDDDVFYSGAGGGGGGCAISKVKLKAGDTIKYTLGTAIAVTSSGDNKAGDSNAIINSSIESYDTLNVTGANNATNSVSTRAGAGGAGGRGSGGNYGNYTGGVGISGTSEIRPFDGAAGGTFGYTGGNAGGRGEGLDDDWDYPGTYVYTGKDLGGNAFIRIYRGNTNGSGEFIIADLD